MSGMPSFGGFGGAGSPSLPSFKFNMPSVNTANPSYSDVYNLLSTPPQSMTNTFLPYLQNIQKQQRGYLAPQAQAIQYGGQQGVAAAQSGAMSRGLTGSSIEASGIANAQYGTQSKLASLYGGLATSQSSQMAQAIMQSMGMDIQNNQSMYQNLAQALAQNVAQNQQQTMFGQQMAQNQQLAHQGQNYGLLGSALGGGAMVLGGALAGL